MTHQNTGRMRNDQPSTKKPTVRDLEWIAGFLEGEGSFTKHGEVKAAQVNVDPLAKLQELVGGHLRKKDAQTVTSNDYWIWWTSGSRGRGIMLTLYKLLSSRRQQQIRKAFGLCL